MLESAGLTARSIFPIRIKETTFRVILDTGMPMSGLMLYGTEAVEKLDLEYGAGSVMIGGAGGSGASPSHMRRVSATIRPDWPFGRMAW